MLSHVIRECEEVRGFKVHDTDMLALQYADDSTLFLNGDLKSGLAINNEKTKVV